MSVQQTRHVARWAANECVRQHVGPERVADMVDAWAYAHRRRNRRPAFRDVAELGALIEPVTNAGGLRRGWVRVGYDVKCDPADVPRLLDLLCSAVDELEPDQWYIEFEEVHPFTDGNGRTGSVLWNWMRGTLERPEAPSNDSFAPLR
jgi:hypothetical protein